MSEKVIDRKRYFAGGDFVEIVAYRIPESDKFPRGYKYRFHYGGEGETILRYDNSHGEHDRHVGEDYVEEIPFEGLETHLQKFLNEVEEIRESENKEGTKNDSSKPGERTGGRKEGPEGGDT